MGQTQDRMKARGVTGGGGGGVDPLSVGRNQRPLSFFASAGWRCLAVPAAGRVRPDV
jgi:hypothetical protein